MDKDEKRVRKIVIYARSASGDQSASEQTKVLQVRNAEELASSIGVPVVAGFTDSGVSGCSVQSPGLKALLDFLADNAVNYVLVDDLSRLSRSLGSC